MTQIKPIQIIPGKDNRTNPASSLPIDLNPAQRSVIINPIVTTDNPVTDDLVGDVGAETVVNESTESVLEASDPVPATPAIIGIKEQIISFQADGTAKIDVVLEVQDIDGAVEYDIRVAKYAGNL
jgi:hypothetical protein